MTPLRFDVDWRSWDDPDPLIARTTTNLKIMLEGICVTRNADTWSETTSDGVLVSAHPLAAWLASSWWRLHHEVVPCLQEATPPVDWRLRHEMAAANHGYVWPLLMFTTDRRVMNVQAKPFPANTERSFRYLTGLPAPAAIPVPAFTEACRNFIEAVLARLDAAGHTDSDLKHHWETIVAELKDPLETRKRRVEAQFGFDPEECPPKLLSELMDVEADKGEDVIAELAAVRSLRNGGGALPIRELFELPGVVLEPELPELPAPSPELSPSLRARLDAAALRRVVGAGDGHLKDSVLVEMLGVDARTLDGAHVNDRRPAAIAGRIDENRVRFVARKRHPSARRFELARLIGGCLDTIFRDGNQWLASTDAATARQKYQRAFAAEFLCPFDSLAAFMDGDHSEAAIEDAAVEFGVGERTVSAQLATVPIPDPPIFDYDHSSPMAA